MPKISAYTEMFALTALDQIVVNDGGTTKRISAQNAGLIFRGAMIKLSGDQTIVKSTVSPVAWEAAEYDTSWQPHDAGLAQRLWYGPNRTFVDGDVTVAADTIGDTAHGFVTGEGPVRMTASVTLPAGLAEGTDYWIIRVDDDTYKVATTRALAIAGTQVDITGAASGGTHTLNTEEHFTVPANVSYMEFAGAIKYGTINASKRTFNDILKNEAAVQGSGRIDDGGGSEAVASATWPTAVLAVTEGDRISLTTYHNDSVNRDASASAQTYFSAKIII